MHELPAVISGMDQSKPIGYRYYQNAEIEHILKGGLI